MSGSDNFGIFSSTSAYSGNSYGGYKLRVEELDFAGTLRTQAKVSQMTTGVKSFFLKLADPLFKKKGAGAVVPIKISGTREEPKFGLDVGRVFARKK